MRYEPQGPTNAEFEEYKSSLNFSADQGIAKTQQNKNVDVIIHHCKPFRKAGGQAVLRAEVAASGDTKTVELCVSDAQHDESVSLNLTVPKCPVRFGSYRAFGLVLVVSLCLAIRTRDQDTQTDRHT